MGEENKTQEVQGTQNSGFGELFANGPEGSSDTESSQDNNTTSEDKGEGEVDKAVDTDTVTEDSGDVDKGLLNETLNKLADFLLGKEKGEDSKGDSKDESKKESEKDSEKESKEEVETFTREDVQKMIAEALDAEKANEERQSKVSEVKDEFKDFISYKLENDKDFDYATFKDSNPHYFKTEKKVTETRGEIYPVGNKPSQFEKGFGKLFQ